MSLHKISHDLYINLSRVSLTRPYAEQQVRMTISVLIPVLCICMISAIGSASGLRHIVTMQFDVDRNTEYIKTDKVTLPFQQRQKINNSSLDLNKK